MKSKLALKYFFCILLLGVLARSYGITDHWKNNDHYNFAGTATQTWLRCLHELPLEVTWGRLVSICDPHEIRVYGNHSPFYLWGIYLLSLVFGQWEWVLRSWMLIFSTINIGLVYLIAKEIWPKNSRRWVLASFGQAFFLSGMYFGTHPENVSEFTLVFMLVSALMAIRGRIFAACVWAIVSGLSDFEGYFQFTPLLLYAIAHPKHRRLIFSMTAAGLGVCFLHLAYLRGSFNFLSFVFQKLSDAEYVRPQSLGEKILHPFNFIKNVFTSHSRLLGPLFASFAFYEFLFGELSVFWKPKSWRKLSKEVWGLIFVGFGGISYAIVGNKIAMVHIFNYLFILPFWALLFARFTDRLFEGIHDLDKNKFIMLSLVMIALYPFGIYQSSRVHDVINSIFLAGSGLAFMFVYFRHRLNAQKLWAFLFVGALANFSQVTNYRNEADTEFPFCKKAYEIYKQTGRPVHTKENWTHTKEFLYCRGIPIIYEGEAKSPYPLQTPDYAYKNWNWFGY